MRTKIEEAYIGLKEDLEGKLWSNTPDIRKQVKSRLDLVLDAEDIRCDEHNNPASVIDENSLVATVIWREKGTVYMSELKFGIPIYAAISHKPIPEVEVVSDELRKQRHGVLYKQRQMHKLELFRAYKQGFDAAVDSIIAANKIVQAKEFFQ